MGGRARVCVADSLVQDGSIRRRYALHHVNQSLDSGAIECAEDGPAPSRHPGYVLRLTIQTR